MAHGDVPGDWTEQYVGSTLDLTDYTLSFDDEFDTFDVTSNTGTGPWYAPVHAPFGAATFIAPDAPTNPFSVADGKLTISMTQQADGSWQTGTMQTVNSAGQGFAQEYGYFEMRAAFHGGAGAWPAFWMLPQDTSVPRPEIDIVEAYGGDPAGHHQSVHVTHDGTHDWDSNYQSVSRLGYASSMFDGTFHTYGVMITNDWIIDYFDGKELARFPMNDYFRTPLYLVATLAMNPSEVAQASGQYDMVIDYVRAYVSGKVIIGASSAETLTGTDRNDTLKGMDGDDVLIGGNGNDMLFGGSGRDTFRLASALTLANSDVIGDFNHADDVIQLENSIFKGMGSGALNPKYFYAGSKAHDANDHIIYNAGTGGALYYDSDGTGPRAQVMFATVTNHAQAGLAYDDFVLI